MGELDLKGVTAAVAGDPLESALTAHRQRTTWEWVAIGVGLLATVTAAVLIARAARRELAKSKIEESVE